MKIEKIIYVIRNQKVMMDSDLAKLYGVETKRLNEQVNRNIDRFPEDFMFECDLDDLAILRSQIATANDITHWNHKRRGCIMLFTEPGIAMLSSVLNSPQAIQVNINIIRIFIKMRNSLAIEEVATEKIEKLEKNTNKLFKIVFERMDSYEELLAPKLPGTRKKIGLKRD